MPALQAVESLVEPIQFPKTHVLKRSLIPAPQVTLQLPQEPQSPHRATAESQDIFMIT